MTIKLAHVLLLCCLLIGLERSMSAQLVIDYTKPYVYIVFDHRSPTRLWLRLVNNSRLPIRVRTYSRGDRGEEVGINYAVLLTPDGKLKYMNSNSEVPSGHVQDVSSSDLVLSGRNLLFTVPASDVTEYWYIDTSFRFDLPRNMRGNDPVLHVIFSQQQIP